MSEPIKSISFADLPALHGDLDGGTFSGITTKKDGTHWAVTLLPERAENQTWKKAQAWAAKQGGELPNRPVAALLFANLKDKLTPSAHWLSEEYDASFAWFCYFYYGDQDYGRKSALLSVVAVRLILINSASA